jgi:hypothetical protein
MNVSTAVGQVGFIDKVGIELEGCWGGKPGESPFDFPLKQDVSVHQIGNHPHVGEAATPSPINRREAPAWIKKHWPIAQDERCGMHAHVSVINPAVNYGRLQSREFFDLLLKNLEEWGAKAIPDRENIFWYRMGVHGDGPKNRFCRRIFDPSTQMKLKDKTDNSRRALLNYCWEMHKTLECRVWPVFAEGPEVAASSVEVFFTTVEDFLAERERIERDGFRTSVRPTRIAPQQKTKKKSLFGGGPAASWAIPPSWLQNMPVNTAALQAQAVDAGPWGINGPQVVPPPIPPPWGGTTAVPAQLFPSMFDE